MQLKNLLARRGKSLLSSVMIALVVFVVALVVNFEWLSMTHRIEDEQSQHMLSELVNAQARAIERRLARSLDAAYLLQVEVERNQGNFANFNQFSQHIIDNLGGISNLQLAPGGIVSSIYPIAGNEQAIGHDILRSDTRREEAQLAITESQLTLAGPFKLIQGGTAVIGRNPVVIDNKFWGFVSVLIYLDDLLEATELDELASHGYRFELIKVERRLKTRRTFLTSDQPLAASYLEADITVPNGRWLLKLSTDPAASNSYRPLEVIFCFVFSLTIALFSFYFYRSPERLRRQLKRKTQSLRHRNAVLEQISRGDTLPNILHHTLSNIEQRTGAVCGAIILKDQSASDQLIVSDKMPAELAAAINGLIANNHPQLWSLLDQPRRLTAADIDLSDPYFATYYRCAKSIGLRSCWALPVLSHQQQLVASLIIYSDNLNISRGAAARDIDQETFLISLAIEKFHSADKLKKMQLAVEHSPNGVMIINHHGIIEYANATFSAISGYAEPELLGQSPAVLSVNLDGIEQYQALLEAVTQGKQWRGELQSRRKNGELYWAHNYLSPIHDHTDVVTHCVLMQEDVTEFRRISAQMAYESSHDLLTGLINRAELELHVRQLIEETQHDHHTHAFCFLNLDQFKSVNDSFGHVAGDVLLQKISALLRQEINSQDLLARLGGDEFVIVMKNTPIELAQQRAQQLIEQIGQYRFSWQQQKISVCATIGIIEINHEPKDFIQLLKHSGVACYVAKESGRNRVHLYNAQEQLVTLQQSYIQWASTVRDALDNEKFMLYVQPIIPLAKQSRHKIGFEVLIRLMGDDGQVISPVNFLPAAERHNLATQIDRWVIASTLDWFQQHNHLMANIGFIAINLSGVSIGDESLLQFIIEQFKQRGIDPRQFKFEITETAAISNLALARKFINELRIFGCQFALDDFGSGLSSFAYLKNLQVTTLKIDGMFVKDINNDPINEAMVRSINEIGHVMKMTTVAEFVENEPIRQRLVEIGIDYGQGYGLGKPMPIDQLHSYFARKIASG